MKLNQVTLPALDIQTSKEFYVGLGFTLIVDSPHYARFLCPVGDSTFSIHLCDQVADHSGVVVYFESESATELDEFVRQQQGRGYTFSKMPTDERWLWREARLKDPSGNTICFFFAGENRINPPWRV